MRGRATTRIMAAAACIAVCAGASAQPHATGDEAGKLARSSERALALFSCAILAQHASGITPAARVEADAARHETAARDFSRLGREAARAAGEAFRGLAREEGASALFGGHSDLIASSDPDFFVGFYFGQALLDANERLAAYVGTDVTDLDEAASALAAEAARAFDLQCAAISVEQ